MVVQCHRLKFFLSAGAYSVAVQSHQSAKARAEAGAMTGARTHLQSRCVGVYGGHLKRRFPATLCAVRLHLQRRSARAEGRNASLQQPSWGPPLAAAILVGGGTRQQAQLQESGMPVGQSRVTLLVAHLSW